MYIYIYIYIKRTWIGTDLRAVGNLSEGEARITGVVVAEINKEVSADRSILSTIFKLSPYHLSHRCRVLAIDKI